MNRLLNIDYLLRYSNLTWHFSIKYKIERTIN